MFEEEISASLLLRFPVILIKQNRVRLSAIILVFIWWQPCSDLFYSIIVHGVTIFHHGHRRISVAIIGRLEYILERDFPDG